MESGSSPIAIAPVEIWAEIFDHLLFDPIAFTTSPFFLGCKYHSALEEWQNSTRLLRTARERATLRLVSRAWKSLADAYIYQHYHLRMNSVDVYRAQICSATRLHIEGSCKCPKPCGCADKYYVISKSFLVELCDILMSSDSTTKILIIPAGAWAQTVGESFAEAPSTIIPGVNALEVSGEMHFNPLLFSIYPNLIHLSLDLGGNDLYAIPATFPALKTLILSADSCTSVENFNWIIPNLQHAELTDANTGPEIALLRHFLGKAWPNLISLKAKATWIDLQLPSVIWSHLPSLEYLGASWLRNDDDIGPPPHGHPCEAVGNIENTYAADARDILFQFTGDWVGLKAISDVHCWDELDRPVSGDCLVRRSIKPHDDCDAGTCCRCVEDAVYRCAMQGIRYEDRMGRGLDEYLVLAATLLRAETYSS